MMEYLLYWNIAIMVFTIWFAFVCNQTMEERIAIQKTIRDLFIGGKFYEGEVLIKAYERVSFHKHFWSNFFFMEGKNLFKEAIYDQFL